MHAYYWHRVASSLSELAMSGIKSVAIWQIILSPHWVLSEEAGERRSAADWVRGSISTAVFITVCALVSASLRRFSGRKGL